MKNYFFHISILTLVLVLASFVILWCRPSFFLIAMPIIALYFAVITGLEHYCVTRAAKKDPRTFIKSFLGVTVGSMMIHLVVLMVYMFTHVQQARVFAIYFAICYVIHLAFETIELVRYVKAYQQKLEESK